MRFTSTTYLALVAMAALGSTTPISVDAANATAVDDGSSSPSSAAGNRNSNSTGAGAIDFGNATAVDHGNSSDLVGRWEGSTCRDIILDPVFSAHQWHVNHTDCEIATSNIHEPYELLATDFSTLAGHGLCKITAGFEVHHEYPIHGGVVTIGSQDIIDIGRLITTAAHDKDKDRPAGHTHKMFDKVNGFLAAGGSMTCVRKWKVPGTPRQYYTQDEVVVDWKTLRPH